MIKNNKLIFSKFFSNEGVVINYIDIGARGDILSPWNLFDRKFLKVFGFEPDAKECARLKAAYPDRDYYPTALWSRAEARRLYLNHWQSTSSMYKPNQIRNQDYLHKHWHGRMIDQELNIECSPLDDVLNQKVDPDFIKIDTQGAEYEILKGASSILKKNSPLVLVETWCTEVYIGAPMTHSIMALMDGLGYELLDMNLAAAWKYDNSRSIEVFSKARCIGFDLLFAKKQSLLRDIPYEQAIKLAGLLELFGFRDLAISFLEKSTEINHLKIKKLVSMLLKNSQADMSLMNKIKYKLLRLFNGDVAKWAPLH